MQAVLYHFNDKLHRPTQTVHCAAAVTVVAGSHLLCMCSCIYQMIERDRKIYREKEREREKENIYIIHALSKSMYTVFQLCQ